MSLHHNINGTHIGTPIKTPEDASNWVENLRKKKTGQMENIKPPVEELKPKKEVQVFTDTAQAKPQLSIPLKTGVALILKVVARNSYEEFNKPPSTTVYYCHQMVLADSSGIEYPAQICTDSTVYNGCKEGDMVRVFVKNFYYGKNNVTSLEIVTTEITTGQDGKWKAEICNPVVAGTAASIALQAAATRLQDQPWNVTQYIEAMEAGYAFLMQKANL